MAKVKVLNRKYIESEADILDGIRSLRRKCKAMRLVHDVTGLPPLRRRAAGFEGLARIIIGQQVSVASAEAIWLRFATAVAPMSVERLIEVDDDALRAAGLSRPKIRTLRAVAQAISTGLDFASLDSLTDMEIHDRLTAISGIGPWTADIFMMFCLGRADAFAAGDLALQIAAQRAFELDERPDAIALIELAERWRPWRAVAARLLWAYYREVKSAKSGAPV